MLFVCWMILRICWKRQWCCPRMWSSSFWLLFFCYDCCTHNAEGISNIQHTLIPLSLILFDKAFTLCLNLFSLTHTVHTLK